MEDDERSTMDRVVSRLFWFVVLPLIILLLVVAQIWGA